MWGTHFGKSLEGTGSTSRFQEYPGGQWTGAKGTRWRVVGEKVREVKGPDLVGQCRTLALTLSEMRKPLGISSQRRGMVMTYILK